MHSLPFPENCGMIGTFHFNSDFSGEVMICVRRDHHTEHEYDEFEIPGAALEHLLGELIERKLGNIGEDIMNLILGKISSP